MPYSNNHCNDGAATKLMQYKALLNALKQNKNQRAITSDLFPLEKEYNNCGGLFSNRQTVSIIAAPLSLSLKLFSLMFAIRS